jgi:hypothetical protein
LAGRFGEACGRGLLIVNLLCLFSVAINFFNYFWQTCCEVEQNKWCGIFIQVDTSTIGNCEHEGAWRIFVGDLQFFGNDSQV